MKPALAEVLLLLLTTYVSAVVASSWTSVDLHRTSVIRKCSTTHSSDNDICDPTRGYVCLNGTCASACSVKQLHPCNCPSEDDNYCYLCCGSATSSCQPAHVYGILKPNGETWERDTCRRCRHMPNGMPCDDKSQRRVCVNERCTGNVCRNRSEGRYCDLLNSRLCVDGDCRDPCGDHWSQLVTCECESPASRCELCCFDFRTKQCDSAFRKYGIGNRNGRPIIRVGLSCNRHNHLCNRYGKCAAAAPVPLLSTALVTTVAALIACRSLLTDPLL